MPKISELDAPAALTGLELLPALQAAGNAGIPLLALGDLPRGAVLSLRVPFLADTASIAAADPGAGNVRWNHATQASATRLFISDTDSAAGSLAGLWAAFAAAGYVYLQSTTNRGIWQKWQVSAVSDLTGYADVTLALVASAGSFVDNDPLELTLQQPASVDGLQSIIIACSDETTNLTVGVGKVTFRMPYAFTLVGLPRASLATAQAAGSVVTVDINEAGTSILSTKLTIDNTARTSKTAATACVLSDTSLADDAEITVDIDQVGTALAKGLKVVLIGRPT